MYSRRYSNERTVVNLSGIDFVEKLHPNKHIKNQSIMLLTLSLCLKDRGYVKNDQHYTYLPQCLTDDVLQHLIRDETGLTNVDRETIEKRITGLLCGQCKRSK